MPLSFFKPSVLTASVSAQHYLPRLLKLALAGALSMSVSHAYASNFGCQLNPGYELPEDIALNWLCSFNTKSEN